MNKNLKFAGKTLGAGLGVFLLAGGIFLAVGVVAAVLLTLQAVMRSGG